MGIFSKLFGGKQAADAADTAAPMMNENEAPATEAAPAEAMPEAVTEEAPVAETVETPAEESTQVGYGSEETDKPTM